MIHLRSIERRAGEGGPEAFPFSVPAIASLHRRRIESEVLFFVGENGSGKSTLLEALAIATRRVAVGAGPLERDATLDAVRPLARALRVGWSRQTARGFFMRAEDFFNFARRQREIAVEMRETGERFEDPRVRGYMEGQARAMIDRYGGDLDSLSHGESFLQLFQSRVVPGGLHLIDEPEAALSPRRQLAFLSFMKERVTDGCQFIIATHSPILLSYPGAAIWDFDDGEITPRAYEDLEHVRFTRDFLNAPDRYWRHL